MYAEFGDRRPKSSQLDRTEQGCDFQQQNVKDS
jgi:hypothetical protein